MNKYLLFILCSASFASTPILGNSKIQQTTLYDELKSAILNNNLNAVEKKLTNASQEPMLSLAEKNSLLEIAQRKIQHEKQRPPFSWLNQDFIIGSSLFAATTMFTALLAKNYANKNCNLQEVSPFLVANALGFWASARLIKHGLNNNSYHKARLIKKLISEQHTITLIKETIQ